METAKIPVLTYSIENVIHGPLNALDERGFLIIIGSDELLNRIEALGSLVNRFGFDGAQVHDGLLTPFRSEESEGKPHELMSCFNDPLSDIVPLQFFSYYLALAKGQDPLAFRYDRKVTLPLVKELT